MGIPEILTIIVYNSNNAALQFSKFGTSVHLNQINFKIFIFLEFLKFRKNYTYMCNIQVFQKRCNGINTIFSFQLSFNFTYQVILYVNFYHFGQFPVLKDDFSACVLVISPTNSSYVLRLPFGNNSSVTPIWSLHFDLRTSDAFLEQEARVRKLNCSRFLKSININNAINNAIKSNSLKKFVNGLKIIFRNYILYIHLVIFKKKQIKRKKHCLSLLEMHLKKNPINSMFYRFLFKDEQRVVSKM